MLRILSFVVVLMRTISSEPPIHNSYLPSLGYLPPKPIENEDPESIVIDAPPFGRNIDNKLSGNRDTTFNGGPLSASVHKNSNTKTSFTHFHSGSSSTESSYSYGHDDASNNNNNRPDLYYARTSQRTPTATLRATLSSYNYTRPSYQQSTTGSIPYQNLYTQHHENALQYNLPLNRKTADTRRNYYYSPNSAMATDYQSTNNHISPSTQNAGYIYQNHNLQNQNAHPYFIYNPNYVNKLNNNYRYLPPSVGVEQAEGYSYQQPSIPFNYEPYKSNNYNFNEKQNSAGQIMYRNTCQTCFH